MSGMTPDPAAGANPFGELAKFALAATERNMALARSWSDALLATLKEQSEDAQANLTTLAASLEAMERVLGGQDRRRRPPGGRRGPDGGGEGAADATDVGHGGGGRRAVHADDAGVDRCLHPLQPRPMSRSPIILISAMAKVLTLVQLGLTALG